MSRPTSQRPEQGIVEKRHHPRFKRLVKVQYASAAETIEPVDGWVADCSLGGICLLVPREYQPGTLLVIRPVNAPANTPWVKVEVRNCRQNESDTTWELGCQFVRTPSYSTILLFR